MEHKNGPVDHNNTAQPADDYHVTLADLEPACGITDHLDDVIFGLCDTSHTDTLWADSNKQTTVRDGFMQFCQHLRHTTNADTVYLCERQSLRITTTTSAEYTEDTDELHRALTSAISNVNDCCEAFLLPGVRVFIDQPTLSYTVIPVSGADLQLHAMPDTQTEYLAVIVDADEEYQQANPYTTEAVQAIFTSIIADANAPDTRQIQRAVFDQLKRTCSACSNRITARRHEIFLEDLRYVTVHFERLMALGAISDNTLGGTTIDNPFVTRALESETPDSRGPESGAPVTGAPVTGAPVDAFVWGWQSVASLIENDQYPHSLYKQAELWGETFTTAVDIHMLRESAFRYKDVCEAANLNSIDCIKPLCIKVYPHTLLQKSYLDTLQELLEKTVIRGEQVVLELSENTMVCNAAAETEEELHSYKKHLQLCSDRFGIRVGLSEFGTGHSSLLRASTLEPDVIKLSAALLPDRHRSEDEWADTVSRLSLVANTSTTDPDSIKLKPAQILIDASQLPSATDDEMHGLFEKPVLTATEATQNQSLAA